LFQAQFLALAQYKQLEGIVWVEGMIGALFHPKQIHGFSPALRAKLMKDGGQVVKTKESILKSKIIIFYILILSQLFRNICTKFLELC